MEFAHKDSWGLIGEMKEKAKERAGRNFSTFWLAMGAMAGVNSVLSTLQGSSSGSGMVLGAAVAYIAGTEILDRFEKAVNLDPDLIPNEFVDVIREKMDHDATALEMKGGLVLVNQRNIDGTYSASVMSPKEYKAFKKEFNKGDNILVEIEGGRKDKIMVTQYVGGKLHSEHGKAAKSEYKVENGEVKVVNEIFAEYGKIRTTNPNYDPDELDGESPSSPAPA